MSYVKYLYICQETMQKWNDKMLELLATRGDEEFEKFCQALKATGQAAVVQTYLQKFRV